MHSSILLVVCLLSIAAAIATPVVVDVPIGPIGTARADEPCVVVDEYGAHVYPDGCPGPDNP